jgi:hypothetical protein
MYLIIIKVLVSILAVLALFFVSERSPKLGGILAGIPLGTGIMVFFFGIEQGAPFVMQGIPYSITALVSMLFFTIGFYIGGKYFLNHPILHVISALFIGLLCFFFTSATISLFKINLITSLIIFTLGAIMTVLFFNSLSMKKKSIPKKPTISIVLFRALFITVIVLLITGIASQIGSHWAGMMASFPTALCPVLIILAYSYKNTLYPTVLKSFSYSITTLAIFYLLVYATYPLIGVYYGTLLTYIVCLVYMYGLNKLIHANPKSRSPSE